jgi:hypothetical protein
VYKFQAGPSVYGYSMVPACISNTGPGLHNRRAGAACTQDSDCASEWCETDTLGGICVELCCNDSSCPSGQSCEMIRFYRQSDGEDHWARACVFLPAPNQLVSRP